MDPHTEAYFLRIWYSLMQILFSVTPPTYLLLSSKPSRRTSIRGYRVILPLLTSFAALCLVTEAYNLARPVYVCLYPVRGETFRHPEETRLRIQWMLNLLASVLAAAAGVNRSVEKVLLGEMGEGEATVVGSQDRGDERKIGLKYGIGGVKRPEGRRRELLAGWRRRGGSGEVLMMGAWVVGICAYWATFGRSKEGNFGF